MQSILEYIMSNYTWLLGGTIIILLAIIGSYADKTNFGQGQSKEQDLDNIKQNDFVQTEEINEGIIEEIVEKPNSSDIKKAEINQPTENIQKKETSFEDDFARFDKEFNELLPEKEIIDDDLLDEIDSLSLDKTQKLNLSDIPNLSDVELPKIKSFSPEQEDVWKF